MKYNFCRFYLCLVLVGFSVSKKAKKGKHNKGMEAMIVGGVLVDITKFPAAGRIINMGNMCGCSVLNSVSVLTAAHCFEENIDVDEITVHLGVSFIYDPKTMIRDASKIVIHEDYNKEQPFACDIAIVFVKDPIVYSKKVKKVLLDDTPNFKNPYNKDFSVIGWGWTKYGGEISPLLRMATMRYIPTKTCSRMHDGTIITNDMFCLYGEGKDDACKGDSGGGAYWKGKLVGLVSHGDGCANKDKPTVYTDIYYFRKWIQSKLKNKPKSPKSKKLSLQVQKLTSNSTFKLPNVKRKNIYI